MHVQVAAGAGLAVDEEERDPRPMRFPLERQRAAGGAFLFARSEHFKHRSLLSYALGVWMYRR
jgi:hypothetical protein